MKSERLVPKDNHVCLYFFYQPWLLMPLSIFPHCLKPIKPVLQILPALIFILLLSFQLTAHAALVAGGMVSIDRKFPPNPTGYADMDFSITIKKEPGFNGYTYWAHQFFFKNGDVGYVGLQARTANDKALNFSIWQATGWKNGSASNCGFFSHEGSGVQCWITYPWREGVTYKLRVANVAPGNWSATITDASSGISTQVATIEVPGQWGRLSENLIEFVEDYAQGIDARPSCQSVPSTSAIFHSPRANSGTVAALSSISKTYGACQEIAEASCTSDGVCIGSANYRPTGQVANETVQDTGTPCTSTASGQIEWVVIEVPKNGDGQMPRVNASKYYFSVTDKNYASVITLPSQACRGAKLQLTSRAMQPPTLSLSNTNAGKTSIPLVNGDKIDFVFDAVSKKWIVQNLPAR